MCEASLERCPAGGGELRQVALGVAAVAHLVSGDAEASRARSAEAERAEQDGAGRLCSPTGLPRLCPTCSTPTPRRRWRGSSG